jgi:hypothetical protein
MRNCNVMGSVVGQIAGPGPLPRLRISSISRENLGDNFPGGTQAQFPIDTPVKSNYVTPSYSVNY